VLAPNSRILFLSRSHGLGSPLRAVQTSLWASLLAVGSYGVLKERERGDSGCSLPWQFHGSPWVRSVRLPQQIEQNQVAVLQPGLHADSKLSSLTELTETSSRVCSGRISQAFA
jgi:hypothetical protein